VFKVCSTKTSSRNNPRKKVQGTIHKDVQGTIHKNGLDSARAGDKVDRMI
jgi:hypothetical protein